MQIPIQTILSKQRQFFATQQTKPLSFRIAQLKLLKKILHSHETEIVEALKKDLNKNRMEAVITEIELLFTEIDLVIKNLKSWAKPRKVHTPFPELWPGTSRIYFEPYGSVFIIGPWNYPCLLVLSPLIGAISAGNCAVIKPSELAPHTEQVLIKLINDHFPNEYITAISAGPNDMATLLQEKFDYIFFTGGTHIGKIIMQAAATHLTPVTLELGGKSPCIVDPTANMDYAARRIAWAKTTNAGQVCIAPDYVYVHKSCKNKLITGIKNAWREFYGEDPAQSDSYGRIVNQKHFARLKELLAKEQAKIIWGGQSDEEKRYIAPTLIDEVTWQDPVMQEEIFGPLLPILTYEHIDEVIAAINAKPKPLALYLFSNNKITQQLINSTVSFGGGCINDCIVQVANLNLPFGGIGLSGMSHYHGQFSFETFSHRKSLYKKTWPLDVKLQYPPYTERKLVWLRRLLKL